MAVTCQSHELRTAQNRAQIALHLYEGKQAKRLSPLEAKQNAKIIELLQELHLAEVTRARYADLLATLVAMGKVSEQMVKTLWLQQMKTGEFTPLQK